MRFSKLSAIAALAFGFASAGHTARLPLSRFGTIRRPLETRVYRREGRDETRFATIFELVPQTFVVPRRSTRPTWRDRYPSPGERQPTLPLGQDSMAVATTRVPPDCELAMLSFPPACASSSRT